MNTVTASDVVAPLGAAAATLVVAAGVAKIVGPTAPAAMFAQVLGRVAPRVPRRPSVLRPTARLAGLVEVGVGGLVLVVGGTLSAIVLAAAFAAFAAVSAILLGQAEPVPCGCFGRDEAPVTRAHLVVTLLGLVVAAASAAVGTPAWGGLFSDGPMLAVAGPLLVGLAAWCAYLGMTALPALSSARRSVEAS